MKKTAITWTCLAAILILFCLAPVARAAKTDVVVLINGNDVTGEIKSLEFGELRYSTDSMGTVSIDWEDGKMSYRYKVIRHYRSRWRRVHGILATWFRQAMQARLRLVAAEISRVDSIYPMSFASPPIETDEKKN